MKLIKTLLIASFTFCSISAFAVSNADPVIVNVHNANSTAVYFNISNVNDTNNKCLPYDYSIQPNADLEIKQSQLLQKPDCLNTNVYTALAWGDTHSVFHQAQLHINPGSPSSCLIEHHFFTIKITCQ